MGSFHGSRLLLDMCLQASQHTADTSRSLHLQVFEHKFYMTSLMYSGVRVDFLLVGTGKTLKRTDLLPLLSPET